MRFLKTIIEVAEHYVDAVTYDGGRYIEEFWAGEFFDEYMKVQGNVINASKVRVRRIFVVEKSVIDGTDKEKRNNLESIIRRHSSTNPHMQIRVFSKDKLPPIWSGHERSLLVSDDCLASESYSLSDDGKSPGYVVLNDREMITSLKNRFEDLWNRPDQNWVK